jgi:hypothetical protein
MRPVTYSLALPALIAGTLFVVSGCKDSPTSPSIERPALAGAPADGAGKKQVATFDDVTGPLTCPNGEQIRLRFVGWVQMRLFSKGNSSRVELDVVHVTHTWFNSAGETFVDRELGLNHFYLDENGDLLAFEAGHFPVDGIFGRFIINLTTGEVTFVAGKLFPDHFALACAALT